jgi:hypothetical protein
VISGDGIYNWTTGAVASDTSVDRTNTFVLQPIDLYQNIKHDVDDVVWNVDFGVPGVVVEQTRNADGTTSVTWNSTVAGTLQLSVTCNDGEPIEHVPIPIVVQPGAFASADLICPSLGRTGQPVVLVIVARDRYGNRLSSSPKPRRNLRVEITSPTNQILYIYIYIYLLLLFVVCWFDLLTPVIEFSSQKHTNVG